MPIMAPKIHLQNFYEIGILKKISEFSLLCYFYT